MERDNDDDIPTPDTSRSNSINEDEENLSLPPAPPPTAEKIQSESSPPNDTASNVTEQIRPTLAAKKLTFISSSSESESEPETDFVDVNKNDLSPNGSTSMNAVSLLTS